MQSMRLIVLALALLSGASAFVPSSPGAATSAKPKTVTEARPSYDGESNAFYFFGDASTYVEGASKTMEGSSKPFGYFDPLNLGDVDSVTLAWYRHAEIKHCRVAMAAFVGFIVHSNGITFGDTLLSPSEGVKFSDLKGSALDIWDACPLAGKYQIIAFIGLLEACSETISPHYLRGGKPGDIKIGKYPLAPSAAWMKGGEEAKATKRIMELNNGRLAMIGIMGFVYASTVKGSVPALDFLYDADYAGGLPYAPFATSYHLF